MKFNFLGKIRFIEQRLGDTDSPRIADPDDTRLREEADRLDWLTNWYDAADLR